VIAITLSAAEPNLPGRVPSRSSNAQNPFAGNERAQKAGAKLYARECSECHGSEAQGIGKAPSLRQPLVTLAPAGSLFWIIRNGEIFHGMPSFAHLPEPQRWQIVTYLQTLSSKAGN
jgi:mono/diheme cytochrome c family protein